MKGTLGIGTALIVLNTLLLAFWSRSVAPPADDAKPAVKPAAQRVAILNLTYVVKNYKKFESFQGEMKKAIDPFQKKDAEKKVIGEAIAKEAAAAADPTRRATLEKKLKELQREIEDNKAEAQQALQKKQEEQLRELYADVEKAAKRYAKEKGIGLVMHFNDGVTEAERVSGPNIARKMQAGAFLPLYSEPNIDISKEIVGDLNERLKRKSS